MKKRILAMAVAVSMFMGMLPFGAFAQKAESQEATELFTEESVLMAVTYEPTRIRWVPFNRQNYDNAQFIKWAAVTGNDGKNAKEGMHSLNSLFTGKIQYFKVDDGWKLKSEANASFSTWKITKSGYHHFKFNFKYYPNGTEKQLIKDNQGKIGWLASFVGHNHKKKISVNRKRHSLIQVYMNQYKSGTKQGDSIYYNTQWTKKGGENGSGSKSFKGNYDVTFGFNGGVASNNTVPYGQGDWMWIKANTDQLQIKGNTEGGHEASAELTPKGVITMDNLEPYVTKITAKDTNGNQKSKFKAGEKIYFDVDFNEYIKTYDDSPDTLAKCKLTFTLSGRQGDYQANAVYLKGKTMRFEWTVPAYSDSNALYDNQITFKATNNQNWGSRAERDKIVFSKINNSGNVVWQEHKLSNNAHVKEMFNISYITDIAGNPLANRSVGTGNNDIKSHTITVDNTQPVVNKVNLKTKPGVKEPYVMAGTEITATVYFSEDVTTKGGNTANLKHLSLKTNVKDPDGNYLILSYVNPPNVWDYAMQRDFWGAIPQGAVCENVPYVMITEILGSTGNNQVVDKYGNPIKGTTYNDGTIPAPIQQYTVDTGNPVIDIEVNGDDRIPVTFHNGGDNSSFYIKINVYDEISGLDVYGNTLTPYVFVYLTVDGERTLVPLVYKVTDSPVKPEGVWDSYKRFVNIDTMYCPFYYLTTTTPKEHYIHFDFDDDAINGIVDSMSIGVVIFDAAGNVATAGKDVDFIGDFAETIIKKTGYSTALNSAAAAGEAVMSVEISDGSGIDFVQYQWVEDGNEINENNWTDGEISNIEETETSWKGDITLRDIEPGIEHNYLLYVKATDKRGNVTVSEGFAAYAYLGDASFEYVSYGEGTLTTNPSLVISQMTDVLEDADKKITVKVSGGEDAQNPDWTLEKTLVHTYKEDGSVESFFEAFDVLDGANYEGGEVLESAYGKVTAEVICENTSSGAESTIKMEYYLVTAQNSDVHNITLTPVDASGNEVSLKENENYQTPDDGVLTVTDLSGYTVKAEISDNLIYPGFERSDIDYESSYAAVIRSDGLEISRSALVNADSVNITLPSPDDENVTYGYEYSVKVVVTDIAGNVSEKEYDGMVFDNTSIAESGISAVYTQLENPIKDMGDTLYDQYDITAPADEIYVSSLSYEDAGSETVVEFRIDYLDRSSDMVFMKAWNETIGETKASVPWILLEGDMRAGYVIRGTECEVEPGEAAIRVQDGTNIVRYVFTGTNGKETTEEEILIHASSIKPGIEIVAEGYDELWTQAVNFSFEPYSNVCNEDELVLYAYNPLNEEILNVFEEGLVTEEEGRYVFGIRDKYRNISWYEYDIQNIDTTPPVIESLDAWNPEEGRIEFDFSFYMTDEQDDCENLHAYVTVSPEFAEELGLVAEEGEEEVVYLDFDKIKLTGEGDYSRTILSDTLQGLRTVSEFEENTVYASGEGIFPYKHENGTTIDRSFKLYLEDTAGNVTSEEFTLRQMNMVPQFEGVFTEVNAFLAFTVPVMLKDPVETAHIELDENGEVAYYTEPYFNMSKDAPWVQPGGKYSITYVDAWGYEETVEFMVDEDMSMGAIDVKVSTYELTNEDVKVVLDATRNDMAYIKLEEKTHDRYSVDAVKTDYYGNIKYAELTVNANTNIDYEVVLYVENEDYYNQYRQINITNINKTPIEAEIVYYPERDVDENNITWGEVKAVVTSLDGRELNVSEGELYYTFVLGGDTEHTFTVTDDWGNEAVIKATLPYTIIAQPESAIVEDDTEAPLYEYEVNITAYGSSQYAGRYSAPPDAENPLPAFAGSMVFIFNANDVNAVTYSVEDVGEGVTIMGNRVVVTKNTKFTMVMTDAVGNAIRVPIVVGTKIEDEIRGEVTYVEDERTGTVKAFINIDFAENEGRDVKVVGNSALGYENGMYYREFIENGTYTFYLSDKYGIIKAVVAAVDNIDESKPVGNITATTPGIFTPEGKWQALDTNPTRQNVAFTVTFTGDDDNEPIYIRDIKAEAMAGNMDDITVENYGEKAVVIYRENAQVKIDFIAANGRSGSLILPEVDFIQRNNPTVIIKEVKEVIGALTKSVTLTFEADRDVYFMNSGIFTQEEMLPGKVFTKKISENGEYIFRFVDVAGNETDVKFTVSNINTNTPVLTVDFIGDPQEYINHSLSATASMDMDGVIRHLGVDYNVAANEIITLDLPYSGMYEVLATGANELRTSEIITVTKIDKKAPVIIAPTTEAWLEAGVDYRAKLMENVTGYDNTAGDMTDEITLVINDNNPITGIGAYTAVYTLKDAAGNEAVLTREFTVYDETVLAVVINGEFAIPGSIKIVKKGELDITTNLGGEPYKVYYAKGIKTAAQMKYDGILADGNIIVAENNYYTILVVTQDRQSVLCIVLAEK